MTERPTPAEAKEMRLAKAREYKRNNRERLLEYQRAYNAKIAQDPERAKRRAELNRISRAKYRAKNPNYDKTRDLVKVRARNKIRNLVYEGRMEKAPCERCGDPNTHGHHDDYSKPLSVRWLCPKHHRQVHDELRQS